MMCSKNANEKNARHAMPGIKRPNQFSGPDTQLTGHWVYTYKFFSSNKHNRTFTIAQEGSTTNEDTGTQGRIQPN